MAAADLVTDRLPSPARLRRRPRVRPAALAAALVAAAPLAGCRPDPPRPNVLVLVVDALRADRLGYAGYAKPTSPRLDELARESVWFRNAYAHATWTKPSIAALFTSRYPSELGLLDLDVRDDPRATRKLGADVPTLPEAFLAGGWTTGAAVNQVYLSPKSGFDRGFESFEHLRGRYAWQVNERLEPFLDQTAGRPFFAYVHYLDVHWPYDRVVKGTEDDFGNRFLERMPASGIEYFEAWRKEHLDAAALEALSNRYDAEVRVADAAAGDLFDGLRRRGLWENTIVVVTADHGEGFEEHGEMMHGYAPYAEVARVPLVVRAPVGFGFPAGERATPVGLVDLAPTLRDLARLPADAEARGRSLRPVLAGREAPERTVLVQSETAWALRDARSAVLLFPDQRLEQYDLAADPGERADLGAAACAARCAELARELRRFRELLGTPPPPGESAELSAEEIEELRALGYL